MERDSEIDAVATPRDSRPAASWTLTCVGGITMPRPTPTSTVMPSTAMVGALLTRTESMMNASVAIASPSCGKMFTRPVRVIS